MDRLRAFPVLILLLITFTLALFLIAGCGSAASTNLVPPQMTPCSLEPQKSIYAVDFYLSKQSEEDKMKADTIYQIASQDKALAQQKAIRFLGYEVERWSHVEYISAQGQSKIRAIVTFISPDVIRAIVLNQAIERDLYFQINYLDNYLQGVFRGVEQRNELAFLLILQTDEQSTSYTYTISPKQIVLHNTTSKPFAMTHCDDYLNEPLKSSEPIHAGLFFFPGAVLTNEECVAVVGRQDTSITLITHGAKIGNSTLEVITWAFPFSPLIDIGMSTFELEPPNGEPGVETTPTYQLTIPNFESQPDEAHWVEIGRFVWGVVTTGLAP